MRRLAPVFAVVVAFALPGLDPASAATPDAMAQGLTEAKAACPKASDLKNAATMGKPRLFSDTSGKTAILMAHRQSRALRHNVPAIFAWRWLRNAIIDGVAPGAAQKGLSWLRPRLSVV